MTTTELKRWHALRDAILEEVGAVVASEVADFRQKGALALAESKAGHAELALSAMKRIAELERRISELEGRAKSAGGPRMVAAA